MKKILITEALALMTLLSTNLAKGEENPDIKLEPIRSQMQAMAKTSSVQTLAMNREYMISNFILNHTKKFKSEDLVQINTYFSQLTDYQLQMATSAYYKDPTTMLIISVLVGELGVDRFMLGETGLGVAKLLTGGGLGIWWLIDIFSIENRTKEYNMKQFNEIIKNGELMLPQRN